MWVSLVSVLDLRRVNLGYIRKGLLMGIRQQLSQVTKPPLPLLSPMSSYPRISRGMAMSINPSISNFEIVTRAQASLSPDKHFADLNWNDLSYAHAISADRKLSQPRFDRYHPFRKFICRGVLDEHVQEGRATAEKRVSRYAGAGMAELLRMHDDHRIEVIFLSLEV